MSGVVANERHKWSGNSLDRMIHKRIVITDIAKSPFYLY